MAKIKTSFFCQNCGAQSPKWLGKCPSCQEWNTIVEEVLQKETSGTTWNSSSGTSLRANKPQPLAEIQYKETDRISTDRKSTRLNSSHVKISYAVFCLKKKTRN